MTEIRCIYICDAKVGSIHCTKLNACLIAFAGVSDTEVVGSGGKGVMDRQEKLHGVCLLCEYFVMPEADVKAVINTYSIQYSRSSLNISVQPCMSYMSNYEVINGTFIFENVKPVPAIDFSVEFHS